MRGKLLLLLLALSIFLIPSCIVSTTDIIDTGENDSILSDITEDADKARYYVQSVISAYTTQHNVSWTTFNEGDSITIEYDGAIVSVNDSYYGPVSGTISLSNNTNEYEITYSLTADDGSFHFTNVPGEISSGLSGLTISDFGELPSPDLNGEFYTFQNTPGVSSFSIERSITGSFSADDSNGIVSSFEIETMNARFSAAQNSDLKEQITLNAHNGIERVFAALSRTYYQNGTSSGYTLNEFFIEPYAGSSSSDNATISDSIALQILYAAIESFPGRTDNSWNGLYSSDRIELELKDFGSGTSGEIEATGYNASEAMLYSDNGNFKVYISPTISGGTDNPEEYVEGILHDAVSAISDGKTSGIVKMNLIRSAANADYHNFIFSAPDGTWPATIKEFQIIRTMTEDTASVTEQAKLRVSINGSDIIINASRVLTGTYTITYKGVF